jgi:2-oxoisovalerate dehydrogenase E1 component
MPEWTPLPSPATCHRLTVSAADLRQAPQRDLLLMLQLMHLIRRFEETVLELKDEDLVHGPAHTSVGQEAVAAGAALALRPEDWIGSTHRAHGHFLAKALVYYAPRGYDPLRDDLTPPMQRAVTRTLAEIMGLQQGWCGGRGGSMHLYDGESGNLGSNAIVGGGIPLATGAAWAERLRGRDTVVVSFFGDGAINQGCYHEVSNMAALWGVPVLYLVENNLYAVGTCAADSSALPDLALRALGNGISSLIVDGMDPLAVYLAVQQAAGRMRAQPAPFFIEAKTYRHYHHAGHNRGSAYGYRSREEEDRWLRLDPLVTFPQQLTEAGLLSASDDERLAATAERLLAEALAACTATEGGRRIIPASHWPAPESATRDLRASGAELPAARPPQLDEATPTREMTLVEAIAGVTLRSMVRDERVIVLGEEVANLGGGAYGATRGIAEVYPWRLINAPISETGFVGMGGGLALAGLRPVVEVMFPDFALMASDQLFNQIGKLRHMYGGRVNFPLVLRTRIAAGYGYGGQHSMDPAGYFGLFSGWRIVAPSTPFDYVGLFNTALALPDPVLVLEHGLMYGDRGQVPADDLDYTLPYGQAAVLREGSDVSVATYLLGCRLALQAADELAAEGLSVEVLDLRTLDYTGMDYAALGATVGKTGLLLTVEQAPRSMALAGRIADEVQARYFDYLDAPVAHVTALDVPPPVSRPLEAAVLPDVARVKAAIRALAQRA